jgi:hypothetical protein
VTQYEITQALKRNLEKPVRIVYTSGDVKRVVPISIDHLGFVYEADVGETVDTFFASFDDIEAILPENDAQKAAPESKGK